MPYATPSSSPRIVLGVAGGIAAYKSVELLRRLRDVGYFVSPVLTREATHFVGAVTFSALASEATRTEMYGDATTPIPHTHLGQHADLIVVAPATAHLIARYAMGLGDDLLSATLMASRAPVLLCPAMHTEMWEQPSVQENLATLRRRGVLILEPDSGHLAGGDEGTGRMAEPLAIVDMVERIVRGFRGELSGYHVVITAGGTREAIDPVRVLSNRSSGRQGYALAEVAYRLGARVTLISTVDLALALDVVRGIDVVKVTSAQDMHEAVMEAATDADAVIMAAAVADFTVRPAAHKIKKDAGVLELTFEPTKDILAELSARCRPGQVLVGFAAESTNVLEHSIEKLRRKSVDLLVVNDVSAPGAGFEHPTNEVLLVERDESVTGVSLRSKEAVSYEILTRVASLLSRGAQ
ncbi:MAG TPA: bifunctional phosphopantothenoylcysteine decarboxylase/phosphopantothenate--cysteine ligase CoaBC [Acidimicrobiales bacterium]|nr:bifunctional phosphopantothenoylcysteine decarboxylase/phosphopantothenate--cysteine ligase CoaBC [Acidimicrobiales bacterium]